MYIEDTKWGIAFKAPKTPKSRRQIILPGLAIEVLKHHKVEQAKQKLLLGPAYKDLDLVCSLVDGSPWRPRNLSDSFYWFVRHHGFGALRFHDLRHSHATQMLRQGIHPKIVSERLGHSTIAITLDCYSHVGGAPNHVEIV